MPKSAIAGPCGSCMFSLIRNCQTVFKSGWTILHSHKQCMSNPVSPHPCQHLVLSLFLILAILRGVYWYLIVVFIGMSLMANDVEHLFMCLLAICRKMKTYVYTKTCTWMFTAALFIIAQNWKKPRSLSTGEWLNKLQYGQPSEDRFQDPRGQKNVWMLKSLI